MREYESVVFLGIRVDDPAFKGLPAKDRDYIHGVAFATEQWRQFRPILRHGTVVGYGIPIVTSDVHDDFTGVRVDDLYGAIEKARHSMVAIARRVTVPFEPKLYTLTLQAEAS